MMRHKRFVKSPLDVCSSSQPTGSPLCSRSACHDRCRDRIGVARCRSQGLNSSWRRPRYVFGIDGLQALHLAMKCADAMLESARAKLAWLGEKGDLGMPKFLRELPKVERARLEALVEREAKKSWRRLERAHRANSSSHRKRAANC